MDLQVCHKHRSYNSTATASMAESRWYTQPNTSDHCSSLQLRLWGQSCQPVTTQCLLLQLAFRMWQCSCLQSARQSAYISIALVNEQVQRAAVQSAYARQVFAYKTETECTCLSGGSENTSLNHQLSLGPDQNILQQIVGSHLTDRSRACHGTLHILSLSPTTQYREHALSAVLPRAGSMGSPTWAWNAFSALCPEIAYKSWRIPCP